MRACGGYRRLARPAEWHQRGREHGTVMMPIARRIAGKHPRVVPASAPYRA